ncbi:MAG: nitroreductase [Marinovum sp.]|jgi:nitroreductase|nr:nitroreductase [Marinovum sp.]MDA9159902.1 nitroreductase family protein [Paracoccaceae bacterium]MBT5678673.1 nitroreductase [Marinovum sp.]MBT6526173.1 nitroreductase [Marinovum sp.]MBT7222951.1 nitroreductase [Marinovum sp.]|tara:strand:+ start:91 stop:669 length:579 start_codon:yes stop_codon:yes gene_type:complete
MSVSNPVALDFLLTRRSHPVKTLDLPVPDTAELTTLLTAAARCPDHGKLEPWRFIVLQKPALERLADLAEARAVAAEMDAAQTAKARRQFDLGNLAVAVVEIRRSVERIPAIEQTYSAGAVCLGLVNAALAAGWGAGWLSGWLAHDRDFVEHGLGLNAKERVAGLIYLGTRTVTPPERPRPNIDAVTTWMAE